jgi:hypothetical protein
MTKCQRPRNLNLLRVLLLYLRCTFGKRKALSLLNFVVIAYCSLLAYFPSMHTHVIPPELLALALLCLHCCSFHAHSACKHVNIILPTSLMFFAILFSINVASSLLFLPSMKNILCLLYVNMPTRSNSAKDRKSAGTSLDPPPPN